MEKHLKTNLEEQGRKPDKYAPQKRYAMENRKSYTLPCYKNTEQDIIQKLESVKNKAGYIKELIRADIANANK